MNRDQRVLTFGPYGSILITKRTSLKLSNERQRLLDQVTEIVAVDEHEELRINIMIDAAITHLIQPRQNLGKIRSELDLKTIQ